MIIVTPSFSKSSVFELFSIHTKTKSRRFQIPPVAFFEARFRDGLVWTVGLTVEIKLRLQVFGGVEWMLPKQIRLKSIKSILLARACFTRYIHGYASLCSVSEATLLGNITTKTPIINSCN